MPDVLLAGNEVVTEICFPEFGSCDPLAQPPDGGGGGGGGIFSVNPFYRLCDSTWNNTLCNGAECWRMPFDTGSGGEIYDGDQINFQNNLLSGFQMSNVAVTDLSDNPITTDVQITPRSGGQNISISEVAASTGQCFKVTSTQETTGLTYCLDWEYEPIKGCDTKTVKIRGLYKDGETDCFGFVYPHDNSIRLYGYLVEGKRSNISKTIYGNHVKRRRVESYYTLYINDLIPPMIHHVLARQILAANEIQITFEGKRYIFITDDEYTLASESTGNRMFYYGEDGIQLKLVCEVPGKC